MSFDPLIERVRRIQNPTVLGLDPKIEYVPAHLREGRSIGEALYVFNKGLIDCVCDLIAAVKPNAAYYELYGMEGMTALDKTIRYAKEAGMYVILDAKRGDIGSTAEAYAEGHLGAASAGADSVTVNPYLGFDGVKPFLDTAVKNDKSLFVLVKTSNPSSSEFQDLECKANGAKLYSLVAEKVEEWGADTRGANGYSRVGAVVGATYPEALRKLREEMPHTLFLIPGYGAQGGTAADIAPAFRNGMDGAVVNSSRGLMCAYIKHDRPENYQVYTRRAVLDMKNALASALLS